MKHVYFFYTVIRATRTDRRRAPGIFKYLTNRKSSSPGKTRGMARRFSSPLCSSEIQVDGAVDLTGTTARLYRDYQRPRKWGQVQRGVPSNSIAFRVAALFYPSVLKAPSSLEKARERCLISLNFLLSYSLYLLFTTTSSFCDFREIFAR